MSNTIVGIFDDFSQAQTAVNALTKAGVSNADINIVRNDGGKGYMSYGGANAKDFTTGSAIGNGIANFFDGIFGTDINDDDRGYYSESVRRGSVLVAVNADSSHRDKVADILNQNGVVDFNRRVAQYRASGYQKFDANAPAYTAEQMQTEHRTFADQGEVAIPVIEESLQVGKQVVQRGGVRVHSRVTERPVEETVSLREEHVNVERRAVDRVVSEGDLAAVRDGSFTVTTKGEEVVVGKEARVVEEVVVGKQVTERQETVRDTVKKSDVEVEETTGHTDVHGDRRS